MTKQVNFMCIGAAKCGTTWLFDMLSQHPQIGVARSKEVNYFNPYRADRPGGKNKHYMLGLDWYHSFFTHCKPEQLWGDFSPTYMKFASAARYVYDYNPDCKLIVLLRDPVDRARSHHLFLYQWERLQEGDMAKAIEDHPYLMGDGLYAEQLAPWLEIWPRDSFLFINYAELKTPLPLLHKVTRFLEVAPYQFRDAKKRSNPTKEIRTSGQYKGLEFVRGLYRKLPYRQQLRGWLRVVKIEWALYYLLKTKTPAAQKPKLSRAFYDHLLNYYHDDLQQLQEMDIIDMSNWPTWQQLNTTKAAR